MAKILTDNLERFYITNRNWQGIPSMDITPEGTLYASWYSGGEGEGHENYVIIQKSVDNGRSFSNPLAVVAPEGKTRAYDPAVFAGPDGNLRWYWAQSHGMYDGKCGVWQSILGSTGFGCPNRICDGIMMNKPTVLSTGKWLVPAALWNMDPYFKFGQGKPDIDYDFEPGCYAVASDDEGETFYQTGSVQNTAPSPDEHMIVEKKDGSLWMLIRTKYGIGESFSYDKGTTWSDMRESKIKSPVSRFFIRRMPSGRLLLINHHNFIGRNNLTALLSEDDGETWPNKLLLDERNNVSYPDAAIHPDGTIYIIYDRDRYGASEVLTACITEDEILSGKLQNPSSYLKNIISSRKSQNNP